MPGRPRPAMPHGAAGAGVGPADRSDPGRGRGAAQPATR
jgi:hypothetical protein